MELEVDTDDRLTTHDVTDRVADAVPAGVESGVCTVFVTHTTAGVVVNEAEAGLRRDLLAMVERMVPDDDYAHDAVDDNADAHLRATLLGESVSLPVESGDLALGRWQSVLLVECDGPRTRTLDVRVTTP